MTSASVLDLWEAGLPMTPAARAVLLLRAAGEIGVDEWPAGRRDQALLEAYFPGRQLEAVADCPGCGTTLEVELDPDALAAPGDAVPIEVERDGWRVTARAPTSGDLASLPPGTSPDELQAGLLELCVVAAEYDGTPASATELPHPVVEAIDTALAEADPGAEITLGLSCADCGTTWTEPLDAVGFAWASVESSARTLATDVHTLARAYGWSEAQILALSPFRRHLYLSAVAP